jgi:SAM-dependent methyltransferase
VRQARAGGHLLYRGDYHNARQLLAAMGRRLARARPPLSGSLAARWRELRARRREDHTVLARLLVPVEPDLRVALRRAPDLAAALAPVVGDTGGLGALLPLREVLGAVGAAEWRRRGVEVPEIGGRVHPHHGVFAPVRREYVGLVAAELGTRSLDGRVAFDLGTGTGVLAILLARHGARVVATDVSPAAAACARENVERFGLSGRVEVIEADLFPPGRADLAVANPPWLPGEAASALDRAVYDPGGGFLDRFLTGLRDHLAPGGEGWLVLSDLAEVLELRAPGAVEAAAAAAGLSVSALRSARPSHPRAADAGDPLHEARARETVTLYRLRP